MARKISVSVTLAPVSVGVIDRLAEEQEVSRSEMVRRAVSRFLELNARKVQRKSVKAAAQNIAA